MRRGVKHVYGPAFASDLTRARTPLISRTMSEHAGHDADGLDHDEPKTPMWLPLLGGVLFLLAFMLFLVTRSDEQPALLDEVQAPSAAIEGAGPDDPQPSQAAPDQGHPSHGADQH